MEDTVSTVPAVQQAGEGTDTRGRAVKPNRLGSRLTWIVLIFAAAVFLGCIVSPPSLLDDVDAVQAQIARNMVTSGDWVTARVDGIPFLEKAPLIYWVVGISYKIFGAHDWAARIPVALSAIGLCWVTAAFGAWAFGRRAGFYSGLCLATCIGLWLFTRIILPDAALTLTIALAMWSFLRALDDEEPHPRAWAATLAASLGIGLLLKSLIAIVFPIGAAVVYLLWTRQFFARRTLAAAAPVQRLGHSSAHCRAMAHSRDHPQSALLQPRYAQHSGPVSRLPLVLLHQ